MTNKTIILALSCVSFVGLTACQTTPKIEEAKYWQRNSASSSLYMQGPKAQQLLHQDISRCVSEIKELEKLGEIRRAVPANYNSGNELETRTASQQELDQWDTPARDGLLYNEHLEYHDFETCMGAKGWERLEHLPYDEADMARKDYLDRYGKKKKRKPNYGARENVTTLETQAQTPPPFKDLNQ